MWQPSFEPSASSCGRVTRRRLSSDTACTLSPRYEPTQIILIVEPMTSLREALQNNDFTLMAELNQTGRVNVGAVMAQATIPAHAPTFP